MLSQEELAAMMAAEEKRLGVGDPEFLRRHAEIMAEIDQIMERNRLERERRQMLGVREVMEALGVSESKAYVLIRQMNTELEAKGYLTVRGKVPNAYFWERFYNGQPK